MISPQLIIACLIAATGAVLGWLPTHSYYVDKLAYEQDQVKALNNEIVASNAKAELRLNELNAKAAADAKAQEDKAIIIQGQLDDYINKVPTLNARLSDAYRLYQRAASNHKDCTARLSKANDPKSTIDTAQADASTGTANGIIEPVQVAVEETDAAEYNTEYANQAYKFFTGLPADMIKIGD